MQRGLEKPFLYVVNHFGLRVSEGEILVFFGALCVIRKLINKNRSALKNRCHKI